MCSWQINDNDNDDDDDDDDDGISEEIKKLRQPLPSLPFI